MSTKIYGNLCGVATVEGVDYLYSFLGLTDINATASTVVNAGYAILDPSTGEPGAWVTVDPSDFGFDLINEAFTFARSNRTFGVVNDSNGGVRFLIPIPG